MTEQAYTLVVREAFADYLRGHEISEPDEVAEILAGENADKVLKRLA